MESPQIAETSSDRFARLIGQTPEPQPVGQTPLGRAATGQTPEPQRKKCSAIARAGNRCRAWAVTGLDQCAAHAGIVQPDSAKATAASQKAAETRRLARMSVRDRLAHELETDQDALVKALQDGIRLSDRKAAAQSAIRYVQLVYGSQLQKPEDEKPSTDALDVAAMPREERARLARELAEQHPELAQRIMGNG